MVPDTGAEREMMPGYMRALTMWSYMVVRALELVLVT